MSSMNTQGYFYVIGVFVSIVSFHFSLSYNIVNADNPFKVFPINSKPYGKSYSDWTVEFWKWYMKIPMVPGPHPADDPTGVSCAKFQQGPVWFLPGSAGSKQIRNCSIPYGKALLIAPINVECSAAENPTFKSAAELRTCVKQDQDKVNSLKVVIDGMPLSNVSKYRIDSAVFNFTLPENNNLGLDPQVTSAVSDGYWIILEPLTKGNHTIISSGAAIDPTGVDSFASDVTWHVNIK